MATDPVILIVDDEIQIRRLLELTLAAEGYKVLLADTASLGMSQAGVGRPDLIILDLGLPDMNGLDALRSIREWSAVPILILSVRDSEADIVASLDAGADDYLVKPFKTGELLARIRTALRHRAPADSEPIHTIGDLTVDLAARVVRLRGEPVKLTATEYALLALFVRNAGRVLTHRYILEQVWGPKFAEETQYTRVYVGALRKKIEDDPTRPKYFLTESGIGYRMIE